MAGRVLGKHYLDVIGQLLARSQAEPAALARERASLAAIDPDAELAWDQFAATLARVAATVREPVQIEVGQAIVQAAKPEFERWGFDTAEKVLADWDAPFGSLLIDVPEEQMVVTLKYQPGQAFLRAGARVPAALIEGYIRGVITMFGGELLELSCHRVRMDGWPFHLFELRWRANAVPRPVARTGTAPLQLGIRVAV